MNRHELYAVTTARSYRSPWLDRDERHAIALTAAWEAETKLRPPEAVPIIVRRRIADTLRKTYGRRGQRHTDPLPDWFDGAAPDVDLTEWVDVADIIADLADGNPRTAAILTDLACGSTKRAVAARHGITPGRISHILTDVRARCAS